MSAFAAVLKRLSTIPNACVMKNAPLAKYTRFAIGGPAAVFFDANDEKAFASALRVVNEMEVPHMVIGGGTNLVVSDAGYKGVVLRYTGSSIRRDSSFLSVGAGAILQEVVDRSIALGLKGLETMTGIPGYVGGAIYGNAGAYGHSIQELVRQVRVFDGAKVVAMSNEECRFRYRESVFKQRKDWVILSGDLEFGEQDTDELARTAREIRSIRDAKYPPDMKCAGSIFKNLLLRDLPAQVAGEIPPKVIREGKVASAWFLEQTGVKGMRRGDIQVADYHANLIYNDGAGTARDLVAVIREVKSRVEERFGFELEEEVQYVGFNGSGPG
ncbi:MAG: UDP-N-acetylmuramate dehydrogenase [Acidobacteriota bacterium]|nr:UDP-N-acetylmuramate dehydrogenase [Acidobacteriota bacterium]